MDILSAIETRRSAARLTDPGPIPDDLEKILAAGLNAPDHGRLSPCRYIVIEGAAREVLGQAMADARQRALPDAPPSDIEGTRLKAFRAPTIVVAAAKIEKGGKIPEIEQVISVAAAVENMFLAAHGLGYGVMWKTGAPAYDAGVKKALGLAPEDHIVAFLYLGTLVKHGPAAPRDLKAATRRL